MWNNNSKQPSSPSSEPPLAIDTRGDIPVTYPVLDRGSRSPTRNSPNPWNSILAPRASPKVKATRITKAQSPTTTAAARRIRKQKAMEREQKEEEEAIKKGGVAYARMKREKIREQEKAKRQKGGIKTVKVRSGPGKHVDNSSNSKGTAGGKGVQGKKVGGKQIGDSRLRKKVVSSSSVNSGGSSAAAAAKNSRISSSSRTSNRNTSKQNTNTNERHRSSKIPTPNRMRRLKQDADAQESIRALIDKVTIEFERQPSNVSSSLLLFFCFF
jgi:hypothetical protein